MLRIENLTQRYDDFVVFQDFSRHFGPGCYALCEEESTGKSTLLNTLAGVMAPTGGQVWVDGHSLTHAPELARARVAYVPDNCMQNPDLTGRGLLEQVAKAKGDVVDDDVLALAADLGLMPHLDKRFEQMSTGTRRKVFLTAAILGDPAVVIADGPSNGLDNAARDVLIDVFRAWSEDRVVLFASFDDGLVKACGAQPIELAPFR